MKYAYRGDFSMKEIKYTPENFDSVAPNYTVDKLVEALESKDTLEGLVTKCNYDLSLNVSLGNGLYGVIKPEDFKIDDGKPTKNIDIISKVGKKVKFKVKGCSINEDGKMNVELSRKMSQEDCFENYISKLEMGAVIDARVYHIDSYGVFCDIGCGIIALLPIKNVCTTRIKDAKTLFCDVEHIKVIVKSRVGYVVTLSHKELLGTWEEEASKFKCGETVTGRVISVEDYGTFVELTPNLIGLADAKNSVDCKPGDCIIVHVNSMIPEKLKIKLSIIDKVNNFDGMEFDKLNYRIPEDNVIKHWVYTPANCSKLIETVFE